MKFTKNYNNCVKWEKVCFNKPSEDNWVLQHREANKQVQLIVEFNTHSDGYIMCESSSHVGSDYHEAMVALCVRIGLVLKTNNGFNNHKKNNRISTIKLSRQLSKKKINFYKNVAYNTYSYLVDKDLVIKGNKNYNFYSFKHNRDITKIRNSKQFNNSDKHDYHIYYLDIVHLETSDGEDIVELRKIHGKTGNSHYTQNYIHNSDESKNITPIIRYELHDSIDDLPSAKEYLDECEKECIGEYPIDINYLLRSNRNKTIMWDAFISYSSKHITFKIKEESIKNTHSGYTGIINCNLLGVRSQFTFTSANLLDIFDSIINYLFQLLLDREKVSIAKVYNRCIANFDHCMLDSTVYKKLKPILANKFIENFAD